MSSAKVLIIEDDPAILFGLRENFDLEGFEVHSAVEGNLGLELARKERPDLILLDIMLPGMNGFEVCQTLRHEKLDMPILMLTALGQEDDIIRGLNLGADDYITKPFSIGELMARAKNFLKRYQKEENIVIAFGEFSFDQSARQLHRGGEHVELTPKEFGLLQYLLSKPGRALTRDQILDAVWGSELAITQRSVDRCVTSLRHKIEPDHARPRYLTTVQKVGYRWEA